MGIKFLCPNGHKMNVKVFLAGKRGKCPKCGASVRIPQETPDHDSGEDLLGDAGGPGGAVPSAVSVTAVKIRPALPVNAPAIPIIPATAPRNQPAGSAVSKEVDPISQAPNSIWYVRPPSGGQYGPARGDIMRKWVAEGRVSGDSLVWREGFSEWKSAVQLFPSLVGVETSEALAESPPSPVEVPEVPKVARVVRKLNPYESRRSNGTGTAIAVLIVLGIICVALVIGLVYVLSRGNGGKGAPQKSAAVKRA
jgi:GYF domain 2